MDAYNLPGPDWFTHNIPAWQQIFGATGAPRSILEIGAFEGRSTVWMAEHLLAPGGEIVVVDHWRGSVTHDPAAMPEVEARFDANLALLRERQPAARVVKVKAPSVEALPRLLVEGRAGSFDFIYVDGSHEAPDVLTDAALAYPLLRVGGLIGFDDYGWRRFADVNDNPKVAIDAFANVFWKKLALVSGGYQAFFRKLA
jgi:predicted O-methyltransferase YrrM